jgi:AcrR family transcriptional regulator
MSERVNPKRSYDSPRRREQAAATRRVILESAQRLFESRGFAATKMAEIASEAGVALKTVYSAFETKSGVLRALWHMLLRGDEDDVPVMAREWYLETLNEPDPERQLRLNARNARAVKQRIAPLLEVIRHAAPLDAETAALWERIQSDFYENQGAIVQSLSDRGALAPGLGVARGSDILWTLNHPDLWQLLVAQRGWTAEQWEQWFADTSCAQLLAPGSSRATAS